MPGLFLEAFSSVSVIDSHNVLRLQQVIALRHSMTFQRNLVHKQTILSPSTVPQLSKCLKFEAVWGVLTCQMI